jgi:diguanylate cyclase (GGDEF)-like protein/PAS domain S-box-containing protein
VIGPVTAPLGSAGLADCISDAVVVYGPDRKVTLWNQAAEHLFGLPASAALGADAGSVIGHVDPPPPPDGGAVRTRWTDQLLMVRPDGVELHVERQFTFPSVGGRPSGETVLVLTSLDDRRKADAVARQFTAILDSSSEAILSKTRTGTIATWNRAAERMYGYSTEEVIGRHVSILVPADRRGELQEILDRVSAGASTERLETVRMRKDGSQARVVLSVSPLTDESGLVVGAVTVADDLTGKRATEAELVLAELRFDGAFATSVFGMAMADLVGRITAVNSAMSDLLGREAREIVGHTLTDFAEDADGQWDPPVPRGGPDSYSDERRYRRSDGAIVWLQTNVTLIRDAASHPLHAMLQVLDITARKQLEHELEHRALHDDLTGLANRALLNDRLEHLLAATERTGRQVGVAFLDVDGFKYVNDALGHEAGDRLLVELGRRLGRAVRPEDTVARFGGDEFVILCSDVTIANMEVLAERVGAAMSQRFAVDGESVSMHLSIGITVGTPTSTAQSLLSEADAAMFRAKELGRGRVATFDDTMRMRAADYLQGEASLRSALGTTNSWPTTSPSST